MTRSLLLVCLCLSIVCPLGVAATDPSAAAPKNEVTRAEHFLQKFEAKVGRMRGQSFNLGYEDNEALKRIKSLSEKYPGDPAVAALFERSRNALMTSKGDFMMITPEMMAYRDNEKKLKEQFGKLADQEWNTMIGRVQEKGVALPKPFPAPDPGEVSIHSLLDRYVVLEDFQYPANQFFDLGREFVAVGSGAQGYYFVDIGGQAWLAPYEALKRYRRLINRSLPEEGKWTILGKIVGVDMVIPQAEKVKTIGARWGWTVRPVAIYIPGHTFAILDSNSEEGGVFAGEEKIEEIKGPLYTVRTIPENVAPEELVKIFATSVKEKNLDLFLDCIDPARKKTRTAISLIRYHWDLHLGRFAELYVHTTTDPAVVEVVKGFDSQGDLETFFLDDKQRKTVQEISGDVVERATVTSRAWDERGRQYGSPKPHYLRRVNKGRWYIENYEQPF